MTRSADETITVLVVDDEALIRAGFAALVDASDGLTTVGEAATGVEAVRMSRALSPDVVLMDLRMPIMDGVEATRHIVADGEARVLVVTTFDDDHHVFGALRAGASGFVLKDTPPVRLIDAIRTVASGEALLAPGVTRRLIAAYASAPSAERAGASRHEAGLADLTDREREILLQVATGRSNSEIAVAEHLSVATVKTHVSRLLTKLGARDRAQLVVIAYETGLVRPSA
jgi:DNA-binding NarL/FixJ family response regulator